MRHTTHHSVASPVLLCALLAFAACDDDNGSTETDAGVGKPAGWSAESHSDQVEANYAVVFPDGKVNRLDITITAANWQKMLDDMTQKYGEFGKGGGGVKPGRGDGGAPPPRDGGARPPADGGTPPPRDGGAPPPPADGGGVPGMPDPAAACNGKKAADSCEIKVMMSSIKGTCLSVSGTLLCVPDDAVNACSGKKAKDSCRITMMGMSVAGSCTQSGGVLFCATAGGMKPPQGDGGAGNPGGGLSFGADPIYVPATLGFAGKSWPGVGVRFKGNSTLNTSWSTGTYKISLRLDTDKFADDNPATKNQRFYGFKELSLASNAMDSSYLREKVTADLFRAASVPAPRTAFYRVFIDHGAGSTYFGLYTLVEVPEEPMLKAQFKKSSGNLYKPEGTGANWVTFNETSFTKKTNKNANDYSDVKDAFAALHASQADLATWRTGLEKTFDAKGFIRWLAVNTVMVNWDTYGMMSHNYYVYGDPGDDGVLHWIPWDNNMALMSMGSGGMGRGAIDLDLSRVGSSWPLIYKLYKDPTYKALYLSEIKSFLASTFIVADIQARLKREQALIKPYVTGAEGEIGGHSQLTKGQESTQFEQALTGLLTHVQSRVTAAQTFLKTNGQ